MLLGLSAYCTLADSFRRLKRIGRGRDMRHARRVSVSIDGNDVVEDRRTAACSFDSYKSSCLQVPTRPERQDRVTSTQTPAEDYRSFTRWYSCGRLPSAPRVKRKISWHDLQFFTGNVEMTEIDVERCVSVLVLRIGCPSSLPGDNCR